MPIDTPPVFDPPTPPLPTQAVPVPPDRMDVRPDPGAPLSQQAAVSRLRDPEVVSVSPFQRAKTSLLLRGLTVGAATAPFVAVGGTALAQESGLIETVGATPGTWVHLAASAVQMLMILGMRWLDQRGNDYTRVLGQLDEVSRKLSATAEDLADVRSNLRITEAELRIAKERFADKQAELVAAQSELRAAREALANDAVTRDER